MCRLFSFFGIWIALTWNLYAQEAKIDAWKTFLMPPRVGMKLGCTASTVNGKLRFAGQDPVDKLAQIGWLELKLKKEANNIQLWSEYLNLLDSDDPRTVASQKQLSAVVEQALKQKPNDQALLISRLEVLAATNELRQYREGVDGLLNLHPDSVPGLILKNELRLIDKQTENCFSQAESLAKRFSDDFRVWEHLRDMLVKDSLARSGKLFPQRSFADFNNCLLGLRKEYLDLLASESDNTARKKAIQEEYDGILKNLQRAKQANDRANELVLKESKLHGNLASTFAAGILLEVWLANASDTDVSISFESLIASRMKEMYEMLVLAMKDKTDPLSQSSAAWGLLAKMFLSLPMVDPQNNANFFGFEEKLTPETLQRFAALLNKHFPEDIKRLKGIYDQLKLVAQDNYLPMAALAENQLGVLSMFVLGDMKAAQLHFKRAVVLDSTRIGSFENYLGMSAHMKEKLTWEQMPPSLKEKGDTAEAHILFVRAMMNSEHIDEGSALKHISLALVYDSKNVDALFIKAGLLARRDQSPKTLDEAAALCETAFELAMQKSQPVQHCEYFLISGTIDVLRGKNFSARRCFEDGLQMNPNDSSLKNAINRLSGLVQVEGNKDK